MLPELTNLQVSYPFVPYTGSDSDCAEFIKSIRYMRLYLYTQSPCTAQVVAFSQNGVTIHISGGISGQITADAAGIFAPAPELDSRNSFIEFSSPIQASVYNCQLQLLPQVICPVRSGLSITIPPSVPIDEVPIVRDSDSFPAEVYPEFTQQLIFSSGYNCQISVDNGMLRLFSAQGTGKGRPSAQEVRKLIQKNQNQVQFSDSYYYGMRAVNGITQELQLDVSPGLYLQPTLDGDDGLRLAVNRKGAIDDTSQ